MMRGDGPPPAGAAFDPESRTPPTRASLDRPALARAAMFLVVFGAALATPGFLSRPSVLSLLTTMPFVGCVAIGMTLITISGNIISFSLGGLVGATAMVFVTTANAFGAPVALATALVFGACVNGAQGLVIWLFRANPLIVSIAALSLIYGVADYFAQSGAIYARAGLSYGALKSSVFSLPVEFVIFLALTVLAQLLLSLTRFGRNLRMIGDSFRAAEAAGVRTWRAVAGAYAWAGAFAGFAGVMLAARYDGASMNYGAGYDYDAIAAVLVGGISIKGGEGSALHTLLGVTTISVVQIVLLLQGVRQEWQYLVSGLIVLAVIALPSAGGGRRA